jgi:hypothetical protein
VNESLFMILKLLLRLLFSLRLNLSVAPICAGEFYKKRLNRRERNRPFTAVREIIKETCPDPKETRGGDRQPAARQLNYSSRRLISAILVGRRFEKFRFRRSSNAGLRIGRRRARSEKPSARKSLAAGRRADAQFFKILQNQKS